MKDFSCVYLVQTNGCVGAVAPDHVDFKGENAEVSSIISGKQTGADGRNILCLMDAVKVLFVPIFRL